MLEADRTQSRTSHGRIWLPSGPVHSSKAQTNYVVVRRVSNKQELKVTRNRGMSLALGFDAVWGTCQLEVGNLGAKPKPVEHRSWTRK